MDKNLAEADQEVGRSIRFPKKLWDAIDADAKRSKRSAVKQMEAILSAYYGLEDVDMNRERLLALAFAQGQPALTQAYHSDPEARKKPAGSKRDTKGRKDIEDAIADAREVLRKKRGK